MDGYKGKVTKVWLDVDPGHDDAMALVLAAFHPGIEILGVSTTHGNQSVEKTTTNALRVLQLIGRGDIEVVAGLAKPLVRQSVLCPEIHGESGLDGAELPPLTSKPVDKKAVIHTYECLKKHKNVTIVATGCLTNIAVLLTVYPEVANHVNRVVLMGGAIGVGNTGPAAEFNIQVDPEAAKIVFESGLEVVMVPLEVTHTALVTKNVADRIQAQNTEFSGIVTKWLAFFAKTYKEVFYMPDPPLHDPCAVAYVVAPEIFDCELLRVDVETASPLSYGQTVTDVFHMSKLPKNVTVAKKMKVDKFWDMMIEAIALAGHHGPGGRSAESPAKKRKMGP